MLRSHLKRLRRLLPSALERPLRAAYLIFMHRVRHDWSSDGETTMVRTLTRDFPERSFVEVGANDGISFSTTYGLLVDGWTGLCIEPHPATFETLRRTLARFPRATPVRYAAAATAGRVKLFLARDDPGGTMATIATEDSPWFREHRTEQSVEVDALPLTQLMEQYQVPQRFGMLLVDAEGMDLEVLRATDFIRFRPRLIVTEDYESKNAEKFAFLGSVGYRFVVRRGCNTFWVER